MKINEVMLLFSGLATGSLYHGARKVRKQFIGERLCPSNNSVFIIKTHDHHNHNASMKFKNCTEPYINYKRAVVLLRNPYDAILAEFNRIKNGKTSVADKEAFETEEWREFVLLQARRWRNLCKLWLVAYQRPVLLLLYTQLKQHMTWELYRLFTFLQLPVTYRSMWCTTQTSQGTFHRTRPDWMSVQQLYTTEMQQAVNMSKQEIDTILKDKYHLDSNDIKC